MTYNVFSGTLNPTQSIRRGLKPAIVDCVICCQFIFIAFAWFSWQKSGRVTTSGILLMSGNSAEVREKAQIWARSENLCSEGNLIVTLSQYAGNKTLTSLMS